MQDPAFKVQLFRFVDVFPMLRHAARDSRNPWRYLKQPGVTMPPGVDWAEGRRVAKGLLAAAVSTASRRWPATSSPARMPPRPCRGSRRLWDNGIGFSVDLLGEACVSRREAGSISAATSI